MKDWKRHTGILIFLTVPVFSFCQYKLVTRGQPSPYDSAVLIRIDQYRKETLKLDLGEKLVDSLSHELALMRVHFIRKDSLASIDRQTIFQQSKTIARQQITIADLGYNLQRLTNMGPPPRKKFLGLFRMPEVTPTGVFVIFTAGAITGILISK